MREPADLAFTVHVAGAPTKVFPGPDTAASATQRCVVCGLVLVDNTGWMTGGVAVVDGDERDGMSWFPAGALVGTDKVEGRPGGMIYLRPEGRPLGVNETACA